MSLDNATKELQAALAKLRQGHALISQQIAQLESFLSAGGQLPKRRGRPPKAAAAPAPAAPVAKRGRGRPKKAAAAVITTKSGVKRRKANWSPAAREAARKRMQEYWSQRKRHG